MSESLEIVEENRRSDGEYYIDSECLTADFLFSRIDNGLKIGFSDVHAFIGTGEEWAKFMDGNDESVFISNKENTQYPHWLFEEFSWIENHDELRPVDDYETEYKLDNPLASDIK